MDVQCEVERFRDGVWSPCGGPVVGSVVYRDTIMPACAECRDSVRDTCPPSSRSMMSGPRPGVRFCGTMTEWVCESCGWVVQSAGRAPDDRVCSTCNRSGEWTRDMGRTSLEHACAAARRGDVLALKELDVATLCLRAADGDFAAALGFLARTMPTLSPAFRSQVVVYLGQMARRTELRAAVGGSR